MLSQLYIENIAVIERVTIDFSNQLNVLTGETGAGKSILIDAINAILGQRTSRDLIRTGASSAVVSALFTEISGETEKTLESLGFNADEDRTLLLQREINSSGKLPGQRPSSHRFRIEGDREHPDHDSWTERKL